MSCHVINIVRRRENLINIAGIIESEGGRRGTMSVGRHPLKGSTSRRIMSGISSVIRMNINYREGRFFAGNTAKSEMDRSSCWEEMMSDVRKE